MLPALFWGLLGVFALLLAVLITPVRLQVRLQTDPKLRYLVQVRILGGLSPPLAIIDSARPRKTRQTRTKPRKKPSGAMKMVGGGRAAAAIPQLVKGVMGTIHLDYLRLDVVAGLDDPADTGRLYGGLAPLHYGAPCSDKVVISLQPDFAQQRFDCALDAAAHVTVFALVPVLARFCWRMFGPIAG